MRTLRFDKFAGRGFEQGRGATLARRVEYREVRNNPSFSARTAVESEKHKVKSKKLSLYISL
jgi:hypothetical protein